MRPAWFRSRTRLLWCDCGATAYHVIEGDRLLSDVPWCARCYSWPIGYEPKDFELKDCGNGRFEVRPARVNLVLHLYQ